MVQGTRNNSNHCNDVKNIVTTHLGVGMTTSTVWGALALKRSEQFDFNPKASNLSSLNTKSNKNILKPSSPEP